MSEAINVAKIFGEDVFNDTVMQERLPKKVYKDLKKTIEEGKELDLATADVIAHEMKEWAIEKGATHYTHWFQPLTGVTAEKHDSFISAPLPNGKVLMSFSGKELIKGEQLGAYCKMFNEVTLKPGCEIGYHEHHGESETYYILQGQGEYNDNGTYRPVKAGAWCRRPCRR